MIGFNPCFNGSMYKNLRDSGNIEQDAEFQSLF